LLDNLFRLDGTPAILLPGVMPPMSPGDEVTNTVFPPGDWKPPNRKIKNVTFRGVAFSKTTISQVTFKDCVFKDCLFIGTELNEVEFHGCSLTDCNFWKIRLNRVYLNPDKVKLGSKFRVSAANVGISIFHAMLSNFAEQRQDHFFMSADIKFRRWKRYQIWHDLREERKTWIEAWWEWMTSITHEWIAGFGYRPLRFFMVTIGLFLAVSIMNYHLIGDQIQVAGDAADPEVAVQASFVSTVFYTFSVLTVLGFSTITPSSDFAKILSVLEALASIGWLGMFTAILVKRFLR
jgi:hypothetical protein